MVAIATGARVPEQYDAVVQHELTDRGDLEGNKVTFHTADVTVGKAIHTQGADATKGTVLIHSRCSDRRAAHRNCGNGPALPILQLCVNQKLLYSQAGMRLFRRPKPQNRTKYEMAMVR